jgi:ankyrin repeat protein
MALKKTAAANPDLLEERNLFRETLLHQASYAGNIEAIALLISLGSDLNAVDSDGLTPLHYAVNGEQDDAVEILCKKGADVNKKDDSNETPLKLARKRMNAAAVRILLRHGAKD